MSRLGSLPSRKSPITAGSQLNLTSLATKVEPNTTNPAVPAGLKQERDPAIFGIPDQYRKKDHQRSKSGGVGMRPRQPPAAPRLGQQKAGGADDRQHRGIFRTQSKTGAHAGPQPPAPGRPAVRPRRG